MRKTVQEVYNLLSQIQTAPWETQSLAFVAI